MRDLRQTLSPRNNETNAVAVLEARSRLPQATLEQEMAEERSRAAQRELERTRDLVKQRVADARIAGRKPVMRELFEQLEVCVALAEKARAYDDRTEQLGASRLEVPCPEFLPGSSGEENAIAYRKRHFAEWLS